MPGLTVWKIQLKSLTPSQMNGLGPKPRSLGTSHNICRGLHLLLIWKSPEVKASCVSEPKIYQFHINLWQREAMYTLQWRINQWEALLWPRPIRCRVLDRMRATSANFCLILREPEQPEQPERLLLRLRGRLCKGMQMQNTFVSHLLHLNSYYLVQSRWSLVILQISKLLKKNIKMLKFTGLIADDMFLFKFKMI